MEQHINDICNLSELTDKRVAFTSTDTFALTETLSDTGNVIILREGDKHSIYVAGELIASGNGFTYDTYTNLDNISNVFITAGPAQDTDKFTYNVSTLTYILENSYSLSTLIGDRNNALDGATSDVDTGLQAQNISFTIDGMTYTLTDDGHGNLLYELDGITEITNVTMFNGQNPTGEGMDLSTNIYMGGESVTPEYVTFNIKGNRNITHLSLMKASTWDAMSDVQQAVFIPDELDTPVECDDDQPYAEIPYELHNDAINSGFPSFETPGIQGNHTDRLLIFYMIDSKDGDQEGVIHIAESDNISWGTPIYYGVYDGETSFTAKTLGDNSVPFDLDTNRSEITINFEDDVENMEFGFIAWPAIYGTPHFIFEESDIKHRWHLIAQNIRVTISSTTVLYNVYRTPHMYYGGQVTWTVTK